MLFSGTNFTKNLKVTKIFHLNLILFNKIFLLPPGSSTQNDLTVFSV